MIARMIKTRDLLNQDAFSAVLFTRAPSYGDGGILYQLTNLRVGKLHNCIVWL